MSEHTIELRAAWQHHVADDTSALDRLLGRHREPHRRYHGVDHVAWVIRHVDELAGAETADDLGAIVAAAFYHDAVYDPMSSANERASAVLARRELTELGWDEARADRVAAMVEATATHTSSDRDTAILLDADLAVLGADPAGYGDYARQVRAEYRELDDATWAGGRERVLRAFVDRPSIYITDAARDRWEQRARANLAAELATLG